MILGRRNVRNWGKRRSRGREGGCCLPLSAPPRPWASSNRGLRRVDVRPAAARCSGRARGMPCCTPTPNVFWPASPPPPPPLSADAHRAALRRRPHHLQVGCCGPHIINLVFLCISSERPDALLYDPLERCSSSPGQPLCVGMASKSSSRRLESRVVPPLQLRGDERAPHSQFVGGRARHEARRDGERVAGGDDGVRARPHGAPHDRDGRGGVQGELASTAAF